MVEKKVPPLPTLIAATAIVIGVLGLSYSDIRGLSKPVSDAGLQVSNAASKLSETTNSLKVSLNEIQSEQKKFSDSQTKLNRTVSESLAKIDNFDTALSRLIAGIQTININPANPVDTNSFPGTDSDADILSLFQGAVGNRSPVMSILLEAQRAMENYEYEKVRKLALKAKRLDKDKDESVYDFLIAQAYYREERYTEAIGAFNDALAREPSNGSAWNNLGSAYFAQSRKVSDDGEKERLIRKSVEATKKAYEIEPTSDSVLVNLSIGLNKLGLLDESLSYLNGWKGGPSDAVYRQLGATYALKGDFSATLSNLSESFMLDKTSALKVAVDDDFSAFRSRPEFVSLLESYLGSKVMSGVKRLWGNAQQ